MGYHKKVIQKGKIGEISKIEEELEELKDAIQQNCRIMAEVELSDLYGAIEIFAKNKYNLTMEDLKTMSDITKQVFQEGSRK